MIFEEFILEATKEIYCCAQTKSIYVSRTFSGDSCHCVIDGDIAAYTEQGKETSKSSCLPVESETMGFYLPDVCG